MPDFPYTKWFWRDWLSDPSLKLCSWGARGLWIDMLGLAGISERYGYVLINERPCTPQMLAQVLGGGTAEEADRLLVELARHGVYSIDQRGFIYSRRMVKDERRRALGKHHGQRGGNPALKGVRHDAEGGLSQGVRHLAGASQDAELPLENPAPLTPSEIHHGSSHLPSTKERGLEIASAAASLSPASPAAAPARDPRWAYCYAEIERRLNLGIPLNGSRIHAWLAAGADPDLDIIPTVERLLARRNGTGPPQTLTYFDRAIADALATRSTPLAAGNGSPTSAREARSAEIRRGIDAFFGEVRNPNDHQRDRPRLPRPDKRQDE